MDLCVFKFFENEYQQKLKMSFCDCEGFTNRLTLYRDFFLNEINSLDRIITLPVECHNCSECEHCIFEKYKSESYIKFLGDFLGDLKNNTAFMKNLFDEVISINKQLLNNEETNFNLIDTYIEKHKVMENIGGAIQLTKPLFRVRKLGDYDASNIHELYHVPFDRREISGSMRFTMKGTPALYTAESLPLALKEIETSIDNINAAIFMPCYSAFYEEGFNDIGNHIFASLNALGMESLTGMICDYDDEFFTFCRRRFKPVIAEFILFQAMQFPKMEKEKKGRVEEYILSQYFMNKVQHDKWQGVGYQSCKPISQENRGKNNKFIDQNICFCVNEEKNQRYDEKFLNKFLYARWSKGEELVGYKCVLKILKECKDLIREKYKLGFNMNDYALYCGRIDDHMNDMKNALGKKRYYARKDCKVEMTLMYKLLQQIKIICENPDKYGVMQSSN